MRPACKIDDEIAGSVLAQTGFNALRNEAAIRNTQARDIKLTIQPDTALDFGTAVFGVASLFDWKTQHQRAQIISIPTPNFRQNNLPEHRRIVAAPDRDERDALIDIVLNGSDRSQSLLEQLGIDMSCRLVASRQD